MIILAFTGPLLARLGLHFGPVEMAALLMVAMTSIGWLMGENPTKGVISTMVGILIACIGMDAVTGNPRYHFGNTYLLESCREPGLLQELLPAMQCRRNLKARSL